MMLSGKEIHKNMGKRIFIEPFNEKQLNPNSYNLRLHDELLVYEDIVLDMKKSNKVRRIRIPPEGLVLQPGVLYLGRTVEHTKTIGYVPRLDGRSSIGRLGVFIHVTAGFGDVGYTGYWTLEILVVQPVRIYPYTEICQIAYHEVSQDYENYKGRYQNAKDVQASKFFIKDGAKINTEIDEEENLDL
jgi:dCTP deaminase